MLAALKPTPSGKAPGKNCLTTPYYKPLVELLVPHFLNAFTSIVESRELGENTLKAHITLIPKEGKDHTECQNHRPISLLNVDLKLFTRILASRLAPEMPTHPL